MTVMAGTATSSTAASAQEQTIKVTSANVSTLHDNKGPSNKFNIGGVSTGGRVQLLTVCLTAKGATLSESKKVV